MLQIPDWLDVQADIRPGDSAIVTPRITVSYGQLRQGSTAAAQVLEQAGVRKGQIAAIQSRNPALQMVLLVGLHRLGAAACPLPADETRRKAAFAAVKFDWLLTEEDEKLSSAKVLEVNLDWLAGLKAGPKRAGGFTSPEDISLISMSSGTTSPSRPMPYSVGLMEKRLVTRSLGSQATSRSEKTLILAATGAMNGILALLGVLWSGGTVFMGWTAEQVPAVLAAARIERLFTTAPLLLKVAEAIKAEPVDVSSLKQIHAGGDCLSPNLVRWATKNMCRHIVTDFGTNEAGRIALGPVQPAGYRPERVGYMCPWAEAQTVDENDKVLAPGEEGHLRFKSPLMITGYWNEPELTAQRFKDGWFYSDDIGWVGADGMLVISGRKSDFITVADGRFNPARLDHVFAGHPKVVEAAGFGMPGKNGEDEIWLALVERAPITDAELQEFSAAQFGARAPGHFLRLERLPRNTGGKVVRSTLANLARKLPVNA